MSAPPRKCTWRGRFRWSSGHSQGIAGGELLRAVPTGESQAAARHAHPLRYPLLPARRAFRPEHLSGGAVSGRPITVRTRTSRPLNATTAGRLEPWVELAGETLVPLFEGALFWPDASTLFIADPHFGKAASFRAAGLPLPGGTTATNLARLGGVLDRTGAARLVVLGDLFHAAAGKGGRTISRMRAWRESRSDLDILVVRGNHDRSAGDPPAALGMEMRSEPHDLAPFVIRHHPQPAADGYVLAGHIHPAVRLRGRGRQRARLSCFWFGEMVGVLPAFGDFTGAALVEPAPGDRIFVLAGGEVVRV